MDAWIDRGRKSAQDRSFWTAGIKQGFICDLEFNIGFEKGAKC